MSWFRAAAYWLAACALAIAYLAGERAGGDAPAPEPTPDASSAVPVTEIPAPLRRIALERGDRKVVWERQAAGGWQVIEPAGRSLPAGLLDAFAEQLAAVSLGEHFEGDASDPAFGLGDPSLRIAAEGGEGEGDRLVLVVGARTPTGTAAYARREGQGPVLLVGLNLLYYADLLFDAAR